MSDACLVDSTRCIACRACQVACKQWNRLPDEKTKVGAQSGGYENPPALSSKTYTKITFHEILDTGGALERCVFVKRQCMHCLEPSCVSACPVTALEKVKETGAVIYRGDRCMGCRYCMMACPFNVPTLQWDRPAAYITKCTFCTDRLEEPPPQKEVNSKPLEAESLTRFQKSQRTPACAKVCPTGAIKFGDRDELIAEARGRMTEQKKRQGTWQYIDHIYGENEVGGTSWLYITNTPFEKLGFRMDLGERPYPEYARLALDSVPAAVIAVGLAMGGAYWISKRRNEVMKAEQAASIVQTDTKRADDA